MRIPLKPPPSPASTSSAPQASAPKQTSFGDRLTSRQKTDPKPATVDATDSALGDDADAKAMAELRDGIKKFVEQILTMQMLMVMAGPGPSPQLERE